MRLDTLLILGHLGDDWINSSINGPLINGPLRSLKIAQFTLGCIFAEKASWKNAKTDRAVIGMIASTYRMHLRK